MRRSGRLAAVTAGLTAGELVIVYPSDRVASGVRVDCAKPVIRFKPVDLNQEQEALLRS
jgi:hypothetical protein